MILCVMCQFHSCFCTSLFACCGKSNLYFERHFCISGGSHHFFVKLVLLVFGQFWCKTCFLQWIIWRIYSEPFCIFFTYIFMLQKINLHGYLADFYSKVILFVCNWGIESMDETRKGKILSQPLLIRSCYVSCWLKHC